jgi:hypothetical protein
LSEVSGCGRGELEVGDGRGTGYSIRPGPRREAIRPGVSAACPSAPARIGTFRGLDTLPAAVQQSAPRSLSTAYDRAVLGGCRAGKARGKAMPP